MDLYNGQKIILDGVEATVVAAWAMGRHRKYILSDKRELHTDLDALVANGQLKVVKATPEFKKPFPRD